MFIQEDRIRKKKNVVGFIIHPDTAKFILDINNYSDRILTVNVKRTERAERFILVYAPYSDNYTELPARFSMSWQTIHKVEADSILFVSDGRFQRESR